MTLRTVVQALEDAAASGRNGYRFVDEGSSAEPFFSYAGIERATSNFGGALQALGLRKGDRVALILPDNQDFVFAFLGAVRAGIVPVPIYPPAGLGKLSGYLENTLHIVAKSGARVLVTDGDVKKLLGEVRLRASALEQIAPIELLRKERAPFRPEKVALDDTCFLQFTSGSTSRPKGVVLTHENLASNVRAFMQLGIGIEDGVDSGVSWLPLYHDMGLIGFVVGPVYHKNTVTFIPPLSFLKRPAKWLEVLSRQRGTISFGPNFAYALCVKRIKDDDVRGLDLSAWRVAGCGAEPIRAENLRAFAEKFAPIGLNPRAMLPCYGMAESTLAISFDRSGHGVRGDSVDAAALAGEGVALPGTGQGAIEVVCCGPAFEGHAIAVFDPDDLEGRTPLPDRQVGEIRLRGPSVTRGYFDDPELTEAAFVDGWLRTGDLGYLVDGNVHVCGRIKELIIVNGRNYYPQDLEWEASKVAGVRKGNVIAFGTRKPLNDRERVVVAFETSIAPGEARDALRAGVRKAIRQGVGLTVDDVVPLDAGVLPKTSSGKLQRAATRELYETGRLFGRSPARKVDTVVVAKELAKSQISYVKHALFGSPKKKK